MKRGGKKRTLDDLIADGVARHGNHFDYSTVGSFKDCKSRVNVRCIQHDLVFDVIIDCHLTRDGGGCPSCVHENRSQILRKSTEDFVLQSKVIFGDLLDYSKIVYRSNKQKILLRCLKHNVEFTQRPDMHLLGQYGCPSCQKEFSSQLRRDTFEEFQAKAKETHGDLYVYNSGKFSQTSAMISIKCNKCSFEFQQSGSLHLAGQGCPSCAGRWSFGHDEFVRRARIIHGDAYEYVEIYQDARTKINVKCRNCTTTWSVAPHNHVNNRSGCPTCYKKNFSSKSEKAWLDVLEVPLSSRNVRITLLNGKSYNVDAFSENVVYEFYGSYWHGDPRATDHSQICVQSKRTFGELYNTTLRRHDDIARTFEVKFVWELDWKDGSLFSEHHPRELNARTLYGTADRPARGTASDRTASGS